MADMRGSSDDQSQLRVLRAGPDGHPEQLRRREASGHIVKIAPGRYADAQVWASLSSPQRHMKLLGLYADKCAAPPVFGHRSAATVWGIPYLGPVPDKPEVVRGNVTGGVRRVGARIHHTTLDIPVVQRDGLTVTTPARTLMDLARTQSFESALVSADHALSAGMITHHDLELELEHGERVWHTRRAMEVVHRARAESGSPGESLSRARFHQLGVPEPELQVAFHDHEGLIGFTDFYWRELRCVGEFDGRVKYRSANPSGMDPADVVYAEKIREDRLRALGLMVIRWTWWDALRVVPLEEKLRRAGVLTGPRVAMLGLQ